MKVSMLTLVYHNYIADNGKCSSRCYACHANAMHMVHAFAYIKAKQCKTYINKTV